MNIFVINGTSFVGKSTLLKHLHTRLPGRCAVMDGDDVGRVHPFELSLGWLNLIQDNLLSCAMNFDVAGIDHLLFAFPFPGPDRTDRLNTIFQSQGYTLRWIHLIATDAIIEARFRSRGGTNPDKLALGIELNRAIANTAQSFVVDTSDATPQDVTSIVLEHIRKLINHPRKRSRK